MEDGLKPTQCDIVMEGGITSGVVYPSFIAGLARHFTFRSIGGASVGAVAAAAAAAAQFHANATAGLGDKTAGHAAFTLLGQLGDWLAEPDGGGSNLFSLFQPCDDLERHFRVLVAALNARSGRRAACFAVLAAVRAFPAGPLLGAALLASGWLLAPAGHGPGVFAWILAAFAVPAGSLLQFGWQGWRALGRNRFGACPGLRASATRPPALTEWLGDYLQKLAGLPPDRPLTFGQLGASTPPIELVLMTTGVSEFRAHQLPYASKDLAFRRSEWRHLFPGTVLDWLISHQQAHPDETLALLKTLDPHAGTPRQDVFFMPAPNDLPVIVAARMSLSFPLLMQAVPMLRIRYHGGGVGLKPVWFSDGGLTNNFPIHLFDQLLPSRPTFGVVLDNTLSEDDDPAQRVRLAQNNAPQSAAYADIGAPAGSPSVFKFFAAMLGTMRVWRHEALKRTPGYRDRVVVIRHTASEGGLNLNMPADAIRKMSDSGRQAAEAIVRRFQAGDWRHSGWLNHRFVRMRSTAALLHDTLLPVARAFKDAQQPGYAALWNATGPEQLPAYQLTEAQRTEGLEFFARLVHASEAAEPGRFDRDAPSPMPSLSIAPKPN